ncbi:hypothetical protein H257_06974 [Aphanomyces astaci]|uniref:Uncharacterized protein n=1 Tax=Aphanomyces astaci TaxID=112090 RepID=W4GK61_APHAT|nr:hypothetical protein H257_06974 [Aphanomyces astaci]ETV79736.1 hypothetical protein H257_06974 [Aphanomyces astaci]|eukprot:XP_009830672.1 hypothetical protein H257_06974 [Aphanomyces astaci]
MLDVKWFYITEVNRSFYLWHDEPVPQRKAQSKRHITKVMFLCAVARPRHNYWHHVMWDGKVGLSPFVETKMAQRKSKNRDRSTPITAPMTVTKPSPDFNVLDLGFFNAIQSLQHQTTARTIDDLIKCVEDAFNSLAWCVLDKTYMTLQKVMEESMKIEGDNVYKLPHLKKDLQQKVV